MSLFGRDKALKAAKEIADHLGIVENVAALQKMQKEQADAIAAIADRLHAMEVEMRALKAEIKQEAFKEAQSATLATLGGLNARVEKLAVSLRVLQVRIGANEIEIESDDPEDQVLLPRPKDKK
jgi:hypothetical protein